MEILRTKKAFESQRVQRLLTFCGLEVSYIERFMSDLQKVIEYRQAIGG